MSTVKHMTEIDIEADEKAAEAADLVEWPAFNDWRTWLAILVIVAVTMVLCHFWPMGFAR